MSDINVSDPTPTDTYSLHALTHVFSTFLVPAIHTILCLRQVYPRSTFLTARAYDFPVHQSRHPGVCSWIDDSVHAISTELVRGSVQRVALVIVNPETHIPLERFVWDVGRWPSVPEPERDTLIIREVNISHEEDALRDEDLEEQFRAVLARVAACESRLKAIPPGCTFTLAIELKDEIQPRLAESQAWIASEPGQQFSIHGIQRAQDSSRSIETNSSPATGMKTIPLRSVEAA